MSKSGTVVMGLHSSVVVWAFEEETNNARRRTKGMMALLILLVILVMLVILVILVMKNFIFGQVDIQYWNRFDLKECNNERSNTNKLCTCIFNLIRSTFEKSKYQVPSNTTF